MGPGASPAWQHDVREDPSGTFSFFDNGGTPKVHSQSRVIVLTLNTQNMTANLVSSFTHSKPLLAPSQGDFQPLVGSNWFVGWGQEPYFSEFAPEGSLLFDAHLPSLYQSYTVLKFPWSGSPPQPPAARCAPGRPRWPARLRELERSHGRRPVAPARWLQFALARTLGDARTQRFRDRDLDPHYAWTPCRPSSRRGL